MIEFVMKPGARPASPPTARKRMRLNPSEDITSSTPSPSLSPTSMLMAITWPSGTQLDPNPNSGGTQLDPGPISIPAVPSFDINSAVTNYQFWRSLHVNPGFLGSQRTQVPALAPTAPDLNVCLNDDVLDFVLSLLPIGEKAKCRLVCKRWRATVDGLVLRESHLLVSGERKAVAHLKSFHSNCASFLFKESDSPLVTVTPLLTHFPNLQIFTMRKLPLTDHFISSLVKLCPRLTGLDFSYCQRSLSTLTTSGWTELVTCLPKITKATLVGINLQEAELAVILAFLRRLRFLNIVCNPSLTGDCLATVPPSLESLLIGSNDSKLDHKLPALISGVKAGHGVQVRRLEIWGDCERVFHQIRPRLTNIQQLQLRFNSLPVLRGPAYLSTIQSLPSLKKLTIHETNSGQLKTICSFDDETVKTVIRGCPGLNQIHLLGNRICHRVTDSSLSLIPQCCPQMANFFLFGEATRVTDKTLAAFSKLDSLTTLGFVGCSGLSDRGVRNLVESAPALNNIVFSHSKHITNRTVAALKRFCLTAPRRRLTAKLRFTAATEEAVLEPLGSISHLEPLASHSLELVAPSGGNKARESLSLLRFRSSQSLPLNLQLKVSDTLASDGKSAPLRDNLLLQFLS